MKWLCILGVKLKVSGFDHNSIAMLIITGFVTSKIYNDSQHSWKRIRAHPQGIWHSGNTSLDLIQLHKDSQALRDAGYIKFDAAAAASKFLENLKRTSLELVRQLGMSILALAIFIMLILCLGPYLTHTFLSSIFSVKMEIKEIKLKSQVQPLEHWRLDSQ